MSAWVIVRKADKAFYAGVEKTPDCEHCGKRGKPVAPKFSVLRSEACEFKTHEDLLDAIGDLASQGAPVLGWFHGTEVREDR